MKRWLIAHDEKGYYLRETLCVTHDGVAGEIVYHTKPHGRADTIEEAIEQAKSLETEVEE